MVYIFSLPVRTTTAMPPPKKKTWISKQQHAGGVKEGKGGRKADMEGGGLREWKDGKI